MQLILILMLSLFSCQTMGQTVKAKAGAVPVQYDDKGFPVYKLTDLEDEVSTTIYKGTKSIEGEFWAVGFLGGCTATAVGPKVLFSAAHCLQNTNIVNWKSRKNQVVYRGVCTNHPDYNDRTVVNDYSLCILDEKLPDDFVFASFNTKGSPQKGTEVLLNGYGEPNFRVHHWGKATVNSLGSQDIITCGPANLGSGDSGGALLRWTEDRKNVRGHIIEGTNSRAGGGCSYFNSTSHPNFKSFAESVAAKSGTYICGVTRDCAADEQPGKCEDEKNYLAYITKQLAFANDAVRMCLASAPK